jgi:hypothetical protein
MAMICLKKWFLKCRNHGFLDDERDKSKMITKTKITIILLSLVVLVGIAITVCGCRSKTMSQGLLEQKGIKDAGDLNFIVIEMAEGGGCYLITDRPTLERIYELLNDAKRVSGISQYIRPDMVTMVRRNGRTLSFAFSLWNPGLTQHYSSRPFVEFIKTELVKNSQYLNKARLPAFSISQVSKIESSTKQITLSPVKARKVKQAIRLLSSAYKPFISTTKKSDWSAIASHFTVENPGFAAVLTKPINFQTLTGWTGYESPNGSTALNLESLTVDKMLLFMDSKQGLSLAFHSGISWFVTNGFNPKDLHGKTLQNIYGDLPGQ